MYGSAVAAESDTDSEPEAFPLTRWSLITQSRSDTEREVALAVEELCQRYWFPIYAFIRRKGFSREKAEDITQGFFHKMLSKDTFQQARQEKGKLRTYLLKILQNHLADDYRMEKALKRGGGANIVSIDEEEANGRYLMEAETQLDPAALFERMWARELLELAISRTRDEYSKRGKGKAFELLRDYLGWNSSEVPYREVASTMGVAESTVRVNIFRLRQRFRSNLESEIAETVSDREEIEPEISFLMQLFSA